MSLILFNTFSELGIFSLNLFVTIFQEFYNSVDKPPRVFGMTASPIIGKGISDLRQYFVISYGLYLCYNEPYLIDFHLLSHISLWSLNIVLPSSYMINWTAFYFYYLELSNYVFSCLLVAFLESETFKSLTRDLSIHHSYAFYDRRI
jgi:hypothetical protein